MREVVGELGALGLLAIGHARLQLPLLAQQLAHAPHELGVLGETFHQDVARAVEHGLGVGETRPRRSGTPPPRWPDRAWDR
jgi:hypothetical protein